MNALSAENRAMLVEYVQKIFENADSEECNTNNFEECASKLKSLVLNQLSLHKDNHYSVLEEAVDHVRYVIDEYQKLQAGSVADASDQKTITERTAQAIEAMEQEVMAVLRGCPVL